MSTGRGRHRSRTQAPLLDRLRDGVLSWQWAVLAAVAVFVLVVGLRGLPADLAAARGEGVIGTFTAAEDLGCGRSAATGCSWGGTFESDDGTVHVDDVTLFDGEPSTVGDTARVRYVASLRPEVVHLPAGDTTWMWDVVVVVVSGGYLSGYAAVLVGRARRGR
jgi:hypothetical protein